MICTITVMTGAVYTSTLWFVKYMFIWYINIGFTCCQSYEWTQWSFRLLITLTAW